MQRTEKYAWNDAMLKHRTARLNNVVRSRRSPGRAIQERAGVLSASPQPCAEKGAGRDNGAAPMVILAALLLWICGPAWVSADDSPWQWTMALKQNLLKDSMIMPTSLYIDEEKEQYYVVDSGRNRILSFNREGELLTIFNAGRSLDTPFDMVRSDDGLIWIVEKGRNSLTSVNLKEKSVEPMTLRFDDVLLYPDRLEFSDGLLYVLDKMTGDVVSFDIDLTPLKRYACSDCYEGFIDFKIHEGRIWALDNPGRKIVIYELDGTVAEKLELGDSVTYPYSLAVGPAGYIYILDRQKRNIAVYDKSGTFKYSFLRHGFARGEMYYPTEIRFDPWGRLCVTDEGNARVEVFSR